MGWEVVAYALVSAALSAVINILTAPKPAKPTKGKLEIPTTEEGTPIPVCFGTNLFKQTLFGWSGDPSTTKIKTDSGK